MQYVFIDESGNFDFTTNGTQFFVLSALSVERPFTYLTQLLDLKHDLWENGLEIEYFHAAEDKQATRDQVFGILTNFLGSFKVDSVVVEKRKTFPVLQADHQRFYQNMFEILLKYVLEGQKANVNQISIITDVIPLNKRRNQIEKAIKLSIKNWAGQHGKSYSIQHHASKSELNLQVVDYINWAINRKWSRSDTRSYDLIAACMRSEFDVFRTGNQYFY